MDVKNAQIADSNYAEYKIKLLKCKKCGSYLSAHEPYIIHVEFGMIVIGIDCHICNTKNIIEAKEWKIK